MSFEKPMNDGGVVVDFAVVNEPAPFTMLDPNRLTEEPPAGPLRLTVIRRSDNRLIYSTFIEGHRPFVVPRYAAGCYPICISVAAVSITSEQTRKAAMMARHAPGVSQWWRDQLENDTEEEESTVLLGDVRIRKYESHEIVMAHNGNGVHYTDVAKAISLAVEASKRVGAKDVFVTGDEETVTVSYVKETE